MKVEDEELMLLGKKYGLDNLKLTYNKKHNKYVVTFKQKDIGSNVTDIISYSAEGIKNPGGDVEICKMKIQIMSELMLCGYLSE